jgi:hypothetical protein
MARNVPSDYVLQVPLLPFCSYPCSRIGSFCDSGRTWLGRSLRPDVQAGGYLVTDPFLAVSGLQWPKLGMAVEYPGTGDGRDGRKSPPEFNSWGKNTRTVSWFASHTRIAPFS